jgi:hypothetical protein
MYLHVYVRTYVRTTMILNTRVCTSYVHVYHRTNWLCMTLYATPPRHPSTRVRLFTMPQWYTCTYRGRVPLAGTKWYCMQYVPDIQIWYKYVYYQCNRTTGMVEWYEEGESSASHVVPVRTRARRNHVGTTCAPRCTIGMRCNRTIHLVSAGCVVGPAVLPTLAQ